MAQATAQPPTDSRLPAAQTGKPKARKLSLSDAEDVAKLVAIRLNESEACRKLGINPRTWISWKSRKRNGEEFQALFDRIRGEKIAFLIGSVESAVGQKNEKTGLTDWKPAAELLKITFPDRFGPKTEVNVNAQLVLGMTNEDVEKRRRIFREQAERGYAERLACESQGKLGNGNGSRTREPAPATPQLQARG